MTAIPFPQSSAPGERPQESAGRLINCYAETRGDAGTVWHRVRGASVFGGANPPALNGVYRGGTVVGGLLYAAMGGKLTTLTEGAIANELGNLPGSEKIFIARNNRAPTPQLAVIADGTPFQVVNAANLQAYADPDVGSPNAVCFHDGYFMFTYGDGTIQASLVNDLAINPLHKTTAESNPDGLFRPWSYQGQLYAGGPNTIEVFGPPVNATGFPLTRIGYHITPGLIGQHAIAGFEPEWGYAPIYVASDRTVRLLRGYDTEKISPPELDVLLQAVPDPGDLCASVYTAQGHGFWQLTSADWTWVFAMTNRKWHERRSYLQTKSRLTQSINFNDQWLIGDADASQLLVMDHALHTEADAPVVVELTSEDAGAFPRRFEVPRAEFLFDTGVGIATGTDPIQTDPEVLISWSNDGGGTWSTPYLRKLGRQGKTGARVFVGPTGLTGPRGRRWKVTMSAPVHFGLLGGDMSVVERLP